MTCREAASVNPESANFEPRDIKPTDIKPTDIKSVRRARRATFVGALAVLVALAVGWAPGSTLGGAPRLLGRQAADGGRPPDLWGVTGADLGTQRILRLNYQDSETDGTLKVVLRIATAQRFSVQGSDQFNRSWFRLAVDGDHALLVDFRAGSYCRLDSAIQLESVPLGPLPFDAVPALLLGRLPVAPAAGVEVEEGRVSFADRQNRRWSARVDAGVVVGWTLWQDGEPEVYWSFDGRMAYLSSRREALQMRWRSGRSEALGQPPDEIVPPAGMVEDCSHATSPN